MLQTVRRHCPQKDAVVMQSRWIPQWSVSFSFVFVRELKSNMGSDMISGPSPSTHSDTSPLLTGSFGSQLNWVKLAIAELPES